MSVMSNKKRNKKKNRLKKLLVMVLILFLMLGLAGIWLVHQKNEREKQQRKAEEHLQAAADIGRANGISLEKLLELLTLFYQEEE